MEKLTDTYKLNNGVEIPVVGYGTWQTPDGETCVMAVSEALKSGYRHIDAAATYGNEDSVGEGIKKSGIPREEIFVTGKVWNKDRGYESTKKAFQKSLDDLGLDYMDLYLIHWPANAQQFENWEQINLDTWRAMTELYKEGKIKAIGVANFKPHHMKALMETEVPPMVDQIEYHPGQTQDEIVEFCKDNNILVEAYSPLGTGRVLDNEELKEIAKKYGKSVAQICLRWELQNGVLPLPKSITPSRIKENTEIFDFELSDEDMEKINKMPYIGGSGLDPDTVTF